MGTLPETAPTIQSISVDLPDFKDGTLLPEPAPEPAAKPKAKAETKPRFSPESAFAAEYKIAEWARLWERFVPFATPHRESQDLLEDQGLMVSALNAKGNEYRRPYTREEWNAIVQQKRAEIGPPLAAAWM